MRGNGLENLRVREPYASGSGHHLTSYSDHHAVLETGLSRVEDLVAFALRLDKLHVVPRGHASGPHHPIENTCPETGFLLLSSAGRCLRDDERICELEHEAVARESCPVGAHEGISERAPQPAAPRVKQAVLGEHPHAVAGTDIVDLTPALVLPTILPREVAQELVVEVDKRRISRALWVDEHRDSDPEVQVVNCLLLELPRGENRVKAARRVALALQPEPGLGVPPPLSGETRHSAPRCEEPADDQVLLHPLRDLAWALQLPHVCLVLGCLDVSAEPSLAVYGALGHALATARWGACVRRLRTRGGAHGGQWRGLQPCRVPGWRGADEGAVGGGGAVYKAHASPLPRRAALSAAPYARRNPASAAPYGFASAMGSSLGGERSPRAAGVRSRCAFASSSSAIASVQASSQALRRSGLRPRIFFVSSFLGVFARWSVLLTGAATSRAISPSSFASGGRAPPRLTHAAKACAISSRRMRYRRWSFGFPLPYTGTISSSSSCRRSEAPNSRPVLPCASYVTSGFCSCGSRSMRAVSATSSASASGFVPVKARTSRILYPRLGAIAASSPVNATSTPIWSRPAKAAVFQRSTLAAT